jgi:hypothetical protein
MKSIYRETHFIPHQQRLSIHLIEGIEMRERVKKNERENDIELGVNEKEQ